jgi:Holliday junction resolvasome RuvABC endonuclease subunit
MIYLGIDPGQKGGIAIIADNGVPATIPYSDTSLLRISVELKGVLAKCAIEKVHSMPKQGVASTFSFGQSVGYIKGVLEANGIAYQEIPPQTWKKEFGLNTDKQKSIDVCRRLFPGVSLRATPRCTTDHDGMAEALLIAEYARRKL